MLQGKGRTQMVSPRPKPQGARYRFLCCLHSLGRVSIDLWGHRAMGFRFDHQHPQPDEQ